jgi:hypothetical protein
VLTTSPRAEHMHTPMYLRVRAMFLFRGGITVPNDELH